MEGCWICLARKGEEEGFLGVLAVILSILQAGV